MEFLLLLSLILLTSVSSQDVKGKIVCEGKSMVLNCNKNEYLEIVGGNFGRTSGDVCKYQENNNCISSWSLHHMKEKCNEQQTCTLSATTSEMGDPCPYTVKYLEIFYRCKKELKCKDDEYKCNDRKCIPKSKTCDGLRDCTNGEDEAGCKYITAFACENTWLNISCKPGEVIRVIKGFWGRNDKTICKSSEITTCSAPKADSYLRTNCNYNRNCSIVASSKILGEPCLGVPKYIQIQYTCWTIPRLISYLLNG